MKLIEADYVLEVIDGQLYGGMSAGDEYLYDRKTYDDGLKWCYKLIQNVANHTDDQGNHAHWVVIEESSSGYRRTLLKCSRCGFDRIVGSGYAPHYCEYCGAKMDE